MSVDSLRRALKRVDIGGKHGREEGLPRRRSARLRNAPSVESKWYDHLVAQTDLGMAEHDFIQILGVSEYTEDTKRSMVMRAFLVLCSYQTAPELRSGSTKERNEKGFSQNEASRAKTIMDKISLEEVTSEEDFEFMVRTVLNHAKQLGAPLLHRTWSVFDKQMGQRALKFIIEGVGGDEFTGKHGVPKIPDEVSDEESPDWENRPIRARARRRVLEEEEEEEERQRPRSASVRRLVVSEEEEEDVAGTLVFKRVEFADALVVGGPDVQALAPCMFDTVTEFARTRVPHIGNDLHVLRHLFGQAVTEFSLHYMLANAMRVLGFVYLVGDRVTVLSESRSTWVAGVIESVSETEEGMLNVVRVEGQVSEERIYSGCFIHITSRTDQ